jgi:hypothetical protein
LFLIKKKCFDWRSNSSQYFSETILTVSASPPLLATHSIIKNAETEQIEANKFHPLGRSMSFLMPNWRDLIKKLQT